VIVTKRRAHRSRKHRALILSECRHSSVDLEIHTYRDTYIHTCIHKILFLSPCVQFWCHKWKRAFSVCFCFCCQERVFAFVMYTHHTQTYIHAYIHTYIPFVDVPRCPSRGARMPHIHTYIHTCIHTYIHTYHLCISPGVQVVVQGCHKWKRAFSIFR
jgi:hypothetical protein